MHREGSEDYLEYKAGKIFPAYLNHIYRNRELFKV